MAHSKRYSELKKLIVPKKAYPLTEALELAKKTSMTKFTGSIELHVNLGIDATKSDQSVRATLTLPHSFGKQKRVAAFVTGEKEKEAKEAGAEIVGGEELIEQIAKTGKVDFDVAVATPDMMPKMARVAKVLGPKGLMPNPKTETVGPNVKKMIEELKKGKVTVKNDATGNIHQAIGKTDMDTSALAENFEAVMGAIRKAKPAGAKGTFLKNVTLAPTMGPGVKVEVAGA